MSKKENYNKLLQEHLQDVVAVAGELLGEEKIEQVQQPDYVSNVEGKFENAMLAVMLLKSVGKYDSSANLKVAREIGGGFYHDGVGFGIYFEYGEKGKEEPYRCANYESLNNDNVNIITPGPKQVECFEAINSAGINSNKVSQQTEETNPNKILIQNYVPVLVQDVQVDTAKKEPIVVEKTVQNINEQSEKKQRTIVSPPDPEKATKEAAEINRTERIKEVNNDKISTKPNFYKDKNNNSKPEVFSKEWWEDYYREKEKSKKVIDEILGKSKNKDREK